MLILFCGLVLFCIGAVSAKCSLSSDVDVVVYSATGEGGVGDNSDRWTRMFFSWLSNANSGLKVEFVVDPREISAYYTDGCKLRDFTSLKLWVSPGGSADNQTASLGPGGRDNILDFADTPQGHIMATCAGFYYMAGSYWWYNEFFPINWAPHFWPTVEGPISDIAAYPLYSPVKLSDGRTVLYWGGPTIGMNNTAGAVPNGGVELVAFDAPFLPRSLGAAFSYVGAHVKALFNSPHPEAVAGSGISCSPPLPSGCITSQDQLANWKWLAAAVNSLTGEKWIIPDKLS